MKKIILCLFMVCLLSGCGIFSLNGWILPDDIEFIQTIQKLNTPQEIGDYMLENFTYELHLFYILTPYELYLRQKGDCNDYATFATFMANWHGYEIHQIEIIYKFENIRHWIVVYLENDGYSITDNQYYFSGYPSIINNQLCYLSFNSFKQIVKFDSLRKNKTWTKYIVYDYWNNIVEEGYNN